MNIFKRKHFLWDKQSLKEASKMLYMSCEIGKREELIAAQKEIIADQEKQISVLKETIAAQKEWIDEDEKKLAIYDKIYSEIGIRMDQWFEKQTKHLWNDA